MDKKFGNKDDKTLIKKNIDQLKLGMKIGENIESEFGGVLIPEGTFLDNSKINQLKKLNISSVLVHNQEQSQIDENLKRIENINRDYQNNKDELKSMFKKIRNNNKIEYKRVRELTYKVTTLGNDDDIMNLLTRVRDADEYTYSHLLNVGILAYLFSNWLNLEKEDSIKLTQAGLLHDMGKAKIPDKVLNKPGKLTSKEYEIIKKHSKYGYIMAVDNKNIPDKVSRGILTHHERLNGDGYPLGIKGKKIPFFGRILAVVDTFDAITADRVYQPSSSPFKAIKIFHEETFGAFDYKLVKLFLDKIPNYFVNEKVQLNDGRIATVVFINPRRPYKPIINVNGNYIDLSDNSNIKIKNLVNEK